MRKKTNHKQLIKNAKPPEKVVQVCMRSDLAAEWEELERQLQEEQVKPSGSLSGNPEARRISEAMDALREQMAEHEIGFRLRAVPRRKYQAMIADNPPRKDDSLDNAVGYNFDAFSEALIRISVVEPALDAEDWDALLGTDDDSGILTAGQYDALISAAGSLNRGNQGVPFSRAAYAITHGSAGGSEQPDS